MVGSKDGIHTEQMDLLSSADPSQIFRRHSANRDAFARRSIKRREQKEERSRREIEKKEIEGREWRKQLRACESILSSFRVGTRFYIIGWLTKFGAKTGLKFYIKMAGREC